VALWTSPNGFAESSTCASATDVNVSAGACTSDATEGAFGFASCMYSTCPGGGEPTADASFDAAGVTSATEADLAEGDIGWALAKTSSTSAVISRRGAECGGSGDAGICGCAGATRMKTRSFCATAEAGITFASTFWTRMGPVVAFSMLGTFLTLAMMLSTKEAEEPSLVRRASTSSAYGERMVPSITTEPEERDRWMCCGRTPWPASCAMACFTFHSNAARMAWSEMRML